MDRGACLKPPNAEQADRTMKKANHGDVLSQVLSTRLLLAAQKLGSNEVIQSDALYQTA